jgi:hypothetical protein
MARARLFLREALFLALAVLAVSPLWAVRYPPLEDLPQHLAAIRVLHDYADPRFGFSHFFVTNLGRTQYLAYYLATHVLAFVLGVERANCVFVSLAVGGLPYALRYALRALDRDEFLALFAFPLLWNAHLLLGFVNFIGAITLLFIGLALAIAERREASLFRRVALALIALITFYMHVVPFAFLALGIGWIGLGGGVRASLRRWSVLIPALVASAIWIFTSPAGDAVRAATGFGKSGYAVPQFMPWADALRDAPGWLTDILPGVEDDHLLVIWGVLVLACIACGAGTRPGALEPTRDPLKSRLAARVGLLVPLAALAYFVTPASYDWIWPINARFPLLTLLLLILVLPEPRGLGRAVIVALLAVISARSSLEVLRAFRAFDKYEVGEFDSALAAIPTGQKVVGLIWDRGSRYVKFAPFLHAVAWYQAKRGGAVMFSFADFPQSPFRFREQDRPPRVPPRWEWTPERVDVVTDLVWYDYVLTRGGPGSIAAHPELFEAIFQGPNWGVWHRRGAR